jgi:hypothetical protein
MRLRCTALRHSRVGPCSGGTPSSSVAWPSPRAPPPCSPTSQSHFLPLSPLLHASNVMSPHMPRAGRSNCAPPRPPLKSLPLLLRFLFEQCHSSIVEQRQWSRLVPPPQLRSRSSPSMASRGHLLTPPRASPARSRRPELRGNPGASRPRRAGVLLRTDALVRLGSDLTSHSKLW